MEKAKAEILISKKVKKLHPVVETISSNLAGIEPIQCIRISHGFLQASSEVSKGRVKIPITKPGHRTAIGLSLIIDIDHEDIIFFEMNSAIKGYGGMTRCPEKRPLPELRYAQVVKKREGRPA